MIISIHMENIEQQGMFHMFQLYVSHVNTHIWMHDAYAHANASAIMQA